MRGHRQIGIWYKNLDQIRDWTKTYNEPGKVQCECGYISRNLPDEAARNRWHQQHLDAVRTRQKGEA